MATLTSFTRVRLLPLTITSLCLLLTAKMVDIYHQGNEFSRIVLGYSAYAQEADTDDTKADEEMDVASIDPADATEPVLTTEQSARPSMNVQQFSDIEVDILQSLSKRRTQLDALEEKVRLKEHLLESTEVRLDDKISQIKTLESTVRDLLKSYDKEEEAQIRSLVKIYENMKPKEAARIFDEMGMTILLLVVDRMSERRAAPILAKMSPTKARMLTEELAENRKLRGQQEAELDTLSGRR